VAKTVFATAAVLVSLTRMRLYAARRCVLTAILEMRRLVRAVLVWFPHLMIVAFMPVERQIA
jgi:hypothetical protein